MEELPDWPTPKKKAKADGKTEKSTWKIKTLLTKKKTAFIAVVTIQSIILALEQCVSLYSYYKENAQTD